MVGMADLGINEKLRFRKKNLKMNKKRGREKGKKRQTVYTLGEKLISR